METCDCPGQFISLNWKGGRQKQTAKQRPSEESRKMGGQRRRGVRKFLKIPHAQSSGSFASSLGVRADRGNSRGRPNRNPPPVIRGLLQLAAVPDRLLSGNSGCHRIWTRLSPGSLLAVKFKVLLIEIPRTRDVSPV